ncbi:MAG TPA: lamin tail domain-containing protein, partial [Anaerolineales bacterium]|nr:lamin tail domain-containing protein [Anaerolineales bacterium]
MRHWKQFPRVALVLALVAVLAAGLFSPQVESVGARPLAICPGGIITQWTFLGSVTTPSTGAGVYANGTGINLTYAAGPTGAPDMAISFTGWTTLAAIDPLDYVEFSVDTTGRSDIGFSFDYRSTAAGPNTLDLQYSSDGTTFTSYAIIPLNRDSLFYSLSYDLSSIIAINNNPNTKIRLYGYGAGGGNLRLDNVTISEICPTPTPTDTFTPTNTLTPTDTPIFSLTPSLTPVAGEVIISEVAWAGTKASAGDEWIELYNTRSTPISLNNWRLTTDSGSVDIVLNGTIPANGFFLLERAYDQTVSDVPASQIYFGNLANSNEILRLRKSDGVQMDTANSNGGAWPGGGGTNVASMERLI